MYANGEGVPEDDATAVMWYTKAAEQGHAIAQFNLGFMYANGDALAIIAERTFNAPARNYTFSSSNRYLKNAADLRK
ncbi:MAG: sel1 repeat family protein [Betaproteobacteria bacterium]|jgi:TPR repeat protein|nr:sel1 repeat family protein [Betaproteobacteria bacterium]